MAFLFSVGVYRDGNFKRKKHGTLKQTKYPIFRKVIGISGFFYAVCKDDFKIFAISFGFAMFRTVKLPFFAATVTFP